MAKNIFHYDSSKDQVKVYHGNIVVDTIKTKMSKNYNPSFSTGLLPMAIRWMSSYGPAVCLERPPELRLLRYEDRSFNLWFPWMEHFLLFSPSDFRLIEAKVFARNNPIEDSRSLLGQLPLPNQYNDNSFCLPQEVFEVCHDTLSEAIDFAYSSIWSSPFNREVLNQLDTQQSIFTGKVGQMTIPQSLKMYTTWENMSLDQVLNLNLNNYIRFNAACNMSNEYFQQFLTGPVLHRHILTTLKDQ